MTRAARRFDDGDDESAPVRGDRVVSPVREDKRGTRRTESARRPDDPPPRRPSGGSGARPPVGPSHSWRLYAVPLMIVLTVLAVFQAVAPGDAGETEDAGGPAVPAVPTGAPIVGEAPAGAGRLDIPSAELPPGGAFPVTGPGTWHVVPGATPQAGTGRVFTYTVEIEDGITVAEGESAFATAVDATLADPRSWVGSGQIAVRRIDASAGTAPDFRVSLSAQMTTRGLCGYSLGYEASCWKSDIGRVLINSSRWVRGAGAFDGQLGLYRQYAINHEVGHVFDNRHVPCAQAGALAPVMMQQSFGTSNDYLAQLTEENPQGLQIPRDGKTCAPNPWPFPNGAR